MMGEGLRHRQPVGFGEGIARRIAVAKAGHAADLRRQPQQSQRILHHRAIVFPRPVPFQHGEFGRMQPAAFLVAEHAGEIEDALFPRRQQLLGRKLRRGVQIARLVGPVGAGQHGFKGLQMGLVARRHHQRAAFHFREALSLEMRPDDGLQPPPLQQKGAPVGMRLGVPPGHFDLSKPPCYSPVRLSL